MTRDFSNFEDYTKEKVSNTVSELQPVYEGLLMPVNQDFYARIKEYVYLMPTLLRYYSEKIILPTVMLTPKGISDVQNEFRKDSAFYLELTSFVNTVAILDIFYNGNASDGLTIFHAISRMLRSMTTVSYSNELGLEVDVLDETKRRNVLSSKNKHKVSLLDAVDAELHTHFLGMYLLSTICHIEGINIDNQEENKK